MPADGIADLRKVFRVQAELDGAEAMLTEVWLLMMRHGHASHFSHGGDLPPLRDATRMGDIDVQDIDGTAPHQRLTAIFSDFALARRHRHARALPHPTHAGEVVIPMAWLLEPANVRGLDQTAELDGLLWCPCLIGVA